MSPSRCCFQLVSSSTTALLPLGKTDLSKSQPETPDGPVAVRTHGIAGLRGPGWSRGPDREEISQGSACFSVLACPPAEKNFRCISLGGRPNTHAERAQHAHFAGECLTAWRNVSVLLDRIYSTLLLLLRRRRRRSGRLLARPSPDEAASLLAPESRWASPRASRCRGSPRRPWPPISPQYRFANCQPEAPRRPPRGRPFGPSGGTPSSVCPPACQLDSSAGSLARRIWAPCTTGALQAPDDDLARNRSSGPTQLCLPSAVPPLRVLLRSCAAAGPPAFRDRGWERKASGGKCLREQTSRGNAHGDESVGASSGLPADSLVGPATFRNRLRRGHVGRRRQSELLHRVSVIFGNTQWEC